MPCLPYFRFRGKLDDHYTSRKSICQDFSSAVFRCLLAQDTPLCYNGSVSKTFHLVTRFGTDLIIWGWTNLANIKDKPPLTLLA